MYLSINPQFLTENSVINHRKRLDERSIIYLFDRSAGATVQIEVYRANVCYNNQIRERMTTPNTYLDDFMDKMITVPNNTNRLLRLIRRLDKKAEDIQTTLIPQQARFLSQLKDLKDKKVTELPPALKAEMDIIAQKQKDLYGYSKEKKEIAEQLMQEIGEYSGQLLGELKNKYKDKPEEELLKRRRARVEAGKTGVPVKRDEFYYDLSKQAQYCYCGRHSFGEMVACQNPYCEREWFHMICLQEKSLPEKWYCADCQKQRDKTKNPNSRSYFVNKEQ